MIKFIENIGEYFASNYFDEDFIHKVLDKTGYSAEDIKEFNNKVSHLKDKYFRYKNEYLILKRTKDRIKITNEFHSDLLNALGYKGDANNYSSLYLLNDKEGIPVRNILYRGGKPHLFIMEMQALINEGDNSAPGLFEQVYRWEQWEYVFQRNDTNIQLSPSVINEAISELFLIDQNTRPFYVLMLSGCDIFLMQYEKWFRGSYLRFSLEDLFDEAVIKRDYLALFYFLVSKEALAPDSELILLDQLDEESHKSAYAVTKDLKEGIINAVELLANETVYYLNASDKLDTLDDNFAEKLKNDCTTLIYRLLFIFYAESRQELEILPINDRIYEKGYSLEMLRDLEQVPLSSESSKNGYFFHDSLFILFNLLNKGFNEKTESTKSFSVNQLDTPLFDNNKLSIINEVKFRNYIWQDIICQLSLTKRQSGRTRGRISYSNLGINQLGSVYEGLLSYKGFFAEQEYIEVKNADDIKGKNGTYVVPRVRRGDFTEDEILKDQENPERDKIILKGTFIYRLSGRDRQKSASYYTPEVLTQTVVKYTLKDILERKDIKANDLLELKILEPAMGAAAFHNEVINQLSVAYLELKQKEIKKKVPPGEYREEFQKVKAYIATNNVYGVDINPTAVELGKLSLWLNVIHKDMETPYFGYKLGVGNAVVGAWRKVYCKEDVILEYENGSKRIKNKEWWEKPPRHISFSGRDKRKENEIYHFLLPDKNMIPSAGISLLKDDFQQEIKHTRKWKKEFCKPITKNEFSCLKIISEKIDELFEAHYKRQKEIIEYTKDKKQIWPQKSKQLELISYFEKESFANKRTEVNAPYYKLKSIMDYWCGLWYWNVKDAANLPTRQQFIDDILSILELDINNISEEKMLEREMDVFAPKIEQLGLGLNKTNQTRLKAYKSIEEKDIVSGLISDNTQQNTLFPENRFSLIKLYSNVYKFFHYELEFIEVFKERGGFDIIVGNPPWVKIEFEEKDIISEKYPEVIIRKLSAPSTREFLKKVFVDIELMNIYSQVLIDYYNQSVYSNGTQNYHLLCGQQGNLYKMVLQITFQAVSLTGYIGLLHPENVYDDPHGKILRKEIYPRLKYHFQFLNELFLFSEVGDRMLFSINIYSGKASDINFVSINNLFHPITIDNSFIHNGSGLCGGFKVKSKDGFIWNVYPHKDRIINYSLNELNFISDIFDENPDGKTVQLINIQSNKLLNVLKKISLFPNKILDFENIISVGWDETGAVNDGYIQRQTKYPIVTECEMIYSGPHTHVSNPLYKTPRSICREKGHYDEINLLLINEDYIQRTNYTPLLSHERFKKAIKGFETGKDNVGNTIYDNWIDYYKLAASRMLNSSSERTFQPCIIPPNTSHIHTVISIILKKENLLLELCGISSSIIVDFLIKTASSAILVKSRLLTLPLGFPEIFRKFLIPRTLLLNCINSYYSRLWESSYKTDFNNQNWSIQDNRLPKFANLSSRWSWDKPLRNSFSRRWALIELDVIVSLALGLTLEELLTIYNITFALMQQYEDETYYDQNGNIVYTVNRALTGIGLKRERWEEVKNNQKGDIVRHVIEYELHRGKELNYYPPFEKCDRIEDYKRAWAHFEKVFSE